MQTTAHTTLFGIGRVKVTLIAAGLLVIVFSSVIAWHLSQDSSTASSSPAADRVVVHRPTDRPFPATLSAPATAMQRFYVRKEAQMDAMDYAQVAIPPHNVPTERSRSTHWR
jgi:hypothetical protein